MASPAATLKDETSRRSAIADHGKSYLVEAGAGSGKTAIMAGRVAMLLAGGVAQVDRGRHFHRDGRQRTSFAGSGFRLGTPRRQGSHGTEGMPP